MHGAFIYLIGFAGCGRLTIARPSRRKWTVFLSATTSSTIELIDPDGKTNLPDKVLG